MICCLNPDCPNPLNSDRNKICETCGTPLVLLLRNRFQVIRVLSDEGGFGRTYLAEDVDKLNELCVIKQLAPKLPGNWALKKAMELFQKEAQRLQQLGEHTQIPTLLAYFEQDNYLYLVQQFIDGQNLAKELQLRRKGAGKNSRFYSELEVKQILLDLLPVLKFIHERGVIHRDIKPQNIIRRKKDRKLTLIDFGSSKQLSARVQTKAGTSIGSHGYCPIEQIRDGVAYPASDLFSLGATCFHLLSGTSPFKLWTENGYSWANNWREYLSYPLEDIRLEKVLDKLLKKDIQQRYASADQALNDLLSKQSSAVNSEVQNQQPSPKNYAKVKYLLIPIGFMALLGIGQLWYLQARQFATKYGASVNDTETVKTQSTGVSNLPQTNISKINIPKTKPEKFFLARTIPTNLDSVSSLAISPNGQTFASVSNNAIALWNTSGGKAFSTLKGHTQKVNAIAFNSDGNILFSASTDKTIKMWNLNVGRQIRTLGNHTDSVNTIAVSRSGTTIASGGKDKIIKLWKLQQREYVFLATLKGHSSSVTSVAISPDEKTLVSGSVDKTIKIWNLSTGKQIYTLTGHASSVASIAISPDGKTLASGSVDKTVKLWDIDNGKQIRSLDQHPKAVQSLIFSPDGKTIITGSDDRNIRIWLPKS